MEPVTGTGPVRISRLDDKTMFEAWTENEEGCWDAVVGYVRAGSLGLTMEEYIKVAHLLDTTLIYRAEWKITDEGYEVTALGPHPRVPFPADI